MLSGIKRLIGLVRVEEVKGSIIIDGIPGWEILNDIQRFWSTSRISMNMFTSATRSKVVFHQFFAVDVLYMFEQLYEDRKTRTSRRAIGKIIEELKEKTWLKGIMEPPTQSILDYSKLDEIGFPLLPHQKDFLNTYDRIRQQYQLKGMLLAAPPGSGKTITDLALAVCLKVKVGIIIAPKNSIERVWEATIKYNMPKSPSYWISNMPGQAAPVGRRFYVFHYEALDRALDLAKRLKEKGDDVFIALDESHNFNEINSQRTQNFIELCKLTQSTNILWASGTPIKAMGYECIPLLRTICGDFPAHVEERFKKIYGRDAKRALDILQNRIGLLTFKVPKQQVVDGTPTVKEVNIKTPNAKDFTLERVREDMTKFIEQRLEFYRKGMKDYERLFDDCLKLHEKSIRNSQDERDFQLYKKYVEMIRKFYDPKEMKVEVMFCNSYELRKIIPSLPDQLKKEFKSVRSIIKYVNLKVMGEALGGILGKARSRCHLEMVDYVPFQEIIDNSVKKTVIFTSYVEVVLKTEKVLKELGYKPVLVYGDTNKNLAAIIRQFETDEDTNPLIATFPSLSTAVPLIMANTLIMLNSPFRDHERDQTISRCNRLGQDEQVYVFDCFLDTLGDPNISTRSKDILEWSREQVEAILGVSAPVDLEATMEAMYLSDVPLDVSAEKFIGEVRRLYPVQQFVQ